MKTAQNGKGDKPRKGANLKAYREGWERIYDRKRYEPQSDCCGATAIAAGKSTTWYICQRCGKACHAI